MDFLIDYVIPVLGLAAFALIGVCSFGGGCDGCED